MILSTTTTCISYLPKSPLPKVTFFYDFASIPHRPEWKTFHFIFCSALTIFCSLSASNYTSFPSVHFLEDTRKLWSTRCYEYVFSWLFYKTIVCRYYRNFINFHNDCFSISILLLSYFMFCFFSFLPGSFFMFVSFLKCLTNNAFSPIVSTPCLL